jgi:hypothetical protein
MITHVNKIALAGRSVFTCERLDHFQTVWWEHQTFFIKGRRLMQEKTLLFYPNLPPTHNTIEYTPFVSD